MAATDISLKPVHSDTIQEWASSAAAADATSAPSDGEIIAGHVNNTGLTSGRANWLMRSLSQLYKRVRDTLLPQHGDAGGHENVTITGTAAGTKCTITSTAGEAASTRMLDVVDADGGLGAYIDKEGDSSVRTINVGHATNGAAGVAKLIVRSDNGDASSTEQIELYDTAGAQSFAIQSDGTLVTAMPSYTISLSPQMFSSSILAAGITDTATVYEINGATRDGAMNIADANWRYVACPEERLQVGDTITAVTLHADRGAGVGECAISLYNKSAFATTQLVGTVTINAGAGHQTGSMSGTPHTVTDIKGYAWVVGMRNTTPAVNEIAFQFVEITITRTRVR